jgi:hypothetical protein
MLLPGRPRLPPTGQAPPHRHGFHDARTDSRTVARWWDRWPHANIGIATGSASRLAVVDLDGIAGVAAWDALTSEHGAVTTATAVAPHGRHNWYRLTGDLAVPQSIRGLGEGVDLLGNDGYAIAPPSAIAVCPKHPRPGASCGTHYTWTPPTRQLAPLPAWVPRHLHDRCMRDRQADDGTRRDVTFPPFLDRRRVRRPRRYALAALRGETQRVASAEAGRRNDTLNYAAWRLAPLLHDGSLTEPEIRDALARAASACGLINDDGARAVHTTITSALRSGGRSL